MCKNVASIPHFQSISLDLLVALVTCFFRVFHCAHVWDVSYHHDCGGGGGGLEQRLFPKQCFKFLVGMILNGNSCRLFLTDLGVGFFAIRTSVGVFT